MAGDMKHGHVQPADGEAIAVGEEMVEIRFVRGSISVRPEQSAEAGLHGGDMLADGDLSADPVL